MKGIMKKILIFGAGDGSREILRILINDINAITPTWEVLGFVDDVWIDYHCPEINKSEKGADAVIDGYSIFGLKYFNNSNNIYGICGIMSPCLREKVITAEIEGRGFQLASIVHPNAIIADDFIENLGIVIYPNVSISYNVGVGRGVFINYNSVIGHDVTIGNYTTISPSSTINARSCIGNNCSIGSGATLIPNIKVEDNALVGAGSTIFSKVKTGTSVTDFPRKISKEI